MRDYKRHVWRLESARWMLIIRDYSALPFCYKRRAIGGGGGGGGGGGSKKEKEREGWE